MQIPILATPLIVSLAAKGNLDQVRAVHRAGADIDARDVEGRSAIWHAAITNDVPLFRYLLTNGADRSPIYRRGAVHDTLLSAVCSTTEWTDASQLRSNILECAKLLLAVDRSGIGVAVMRGYEGNPQARGRIPFITATASGDCDLINLLHSHGADIESRSNYGATALHVSLIRHTLDVIMLLLKLGADSNTKWGRGYTALHAAVRHGYSREIVAALLEAGGDPLIREDRGQTAIELARHHGMHETAQVMEDEVAERRQRRALAEEAVLAAAPSMPTAIAQTIGDYVNTDASTTPVVHGSRDRPAADEHPSKRARHK